MKRYNQPIERKANLTSTQLELCFVHMLRDPTIFAYAKQHLQAAHFNPLGEMRYALLWAGTLAAAERNNGRLPEPGADVAIMAELIGIAENGIKVGAVTIDAQIAAEDLLIWVYRFDAEKMNASYYKSMVQDLIVERTVINTMTQEMTLARDVGRPTDLLKLMNAQTAKLQAVLVDASRGGSTAFPKDFKPRKIGKFSTGLTWMDQMMNGGQAPREVYAVLGPTGLGKTTMGIMLSVLGARHWNKEYQAKLIPRPKVSCFFSWEQDKDQLQLRFWSFAGTIDSTRLEFFADDKIQLSTNGEFQPYELQRFDKEIAEDRKQGKPPQTELERLMKATDELSEIVKIFDFSGSFDIPRVGDGCVDEVAAALKQVKDAGFDIGVVVLDYAGAAIRRHLMAKGEDYSDIRHYLANFCNEARFKIANPYDCPVWVFHQLNPESNKRAPGARQHHSYASECGNFAENVWFAFVFSTKDPTKNLCTLFCTKTRRASGDLPPTVLKIEGNLCRMQDTTEWTWEPNGVGYVPTKFKEREVKNTKELRRNTPGESIMRGFEQ